MMKTLEITAEQKVLLNDMTRIILHTTLNVLSGASTDPAKDLSVISNNAEALRNLAAKLSIEAATQESRDIMTTSV